MKKNFNTVFLLLVLPGCSYVPNAINPANVFGGTSGGSSLEAVRSDSLVSDAENRNYSSYLLRGGALSRLPADETDEGIVPQPSEDIETIRLPEPQSGANSFPGLSGVER